METVCEEREAPGQYTGRLGHYEIRRRLGEGGFGQVFEAWDTVLCRSIAIKQLKAGLAAAPELLIREARLAAGLRHPAFVQVFSVDGAGADQVIVMELVEGETLRALLQGHQLPVAQALDISLQVADAMAEAHRHGLVHGDLKPSNLIIEPKGKPRILDFGLARRIDPLATQSAPFTQALGTIAYMSPERLTGGGPDVPGDIYALGVILYEMIGGSRPHAGLHGLALASAQLQSSSADWLFPPGTAPGIVELVRSMTAPSAAQRIASMTAVRARLLALRAGKTPVARRWRKRLSWRYWSPACAAACALLLAADVPVLWRPEAGHEHVRSDALLLQQGMQALRSFDQDGSLDKAVRLFSEVLAHAPDKAAAVAGLSLADSLRYTGDGRDPAWLARAEAAAQQALRLDDQLALAHVASGDAQRLAGRYPEAVLAYGRALELEPHNMLALAGQANLLIARHQWNEAQDRLRQAMQWYPRERRFADLLGTLRYEQGDYRGAEAAFRLSLQLEPDAVFAYANLNAALLRQDRADEALEVLQQGLQVRPNGRLYTNLGTTLFARGDYAGAAEAFRRAVSAAKGSPNDYLKWANLADALRWIPGRETQSRDAYQRAVELLGPLLERGRADPTRLSRMSLYCARLGRHADALSWNARAVAAGPANADAEFRSALVSELAGRRSAAIAALARAAAHGYPPNLIATEPDLIGLRRDPLYRPLSKEKTP